MEEGKQRWGGTSPEMKAGTLSRLLWVWISPLMKLGSREPLQEEHLYQLNVQESTAYCHEKWRGVQTSISQDPHRGKCKNNVPVFHILAHTVGWELLVSSLWKPVWLVTWLIQVYLLRTIVNETAQKVHDRWWHLGLVAAMLAVLVINSMSTHSLIALTLKVGMKLRAIVGMVVFDKVLAMKAVALQLAQASNGQLLNMLTNDTQKFIDASLYFHYTWFSLVEITLIAGLSIWVIGVAATPGITLMFLTVPLQVLLARSVTSLRRSALKYTDARVRLIAEVLTGIRVVKYNGWTSAYLKKVEDLRAVEMRWMQKAVFLRASTSTIKDLVGPLAVLMTFGTYAWRNQELGPSKAFTVVAMFGILQRILMVTPSGIQYAGEALVGLQRLQHLLDSPDGDVRKTHEELLAPVVAVDCTFSWNLTQHDEGTTGSPTSFEISLSLPDVASEPPTRMPDRSCTIENVSISINRGETVGVIGPVGSGKSSLLLALLGEMHCVRGSFQLRGDTVAYVPQQAWILNATIRENVVFGSMYDEARYLRVIHACALDHDISKFEAGHETELGERGVNLSGGQRARLSLARACYSSAEVVLLDDPLAAVDVPTAHHLMQHVLRGLLEDRTVLLVTHTKASLQLCDRVYLMDSGQLRLISKEEVTQLQPDETLGTNEAAQGLANPADLDAGTANGEDGRSGGNSKEGTFGVQEDRAEGVVTSSNYITYLQGAGVGLCSLVLVVFVLGQGVRVTADYWLSVWVDRKYNLKAHSYTTVYAALCMGTLAFSLLRSLLFTRAAILSAKNMHSQMAQSVLRSPQLFFDQHPVGRILNRFSKDQAMVDDSLPTTAQQTCENLIAVLGSMCLIAVLIPWFLLIVPPCLAGFLFFQRRYVATSRELKRLDGISRSPVYEHFVQTLAGITSIRAYRVESRAHDRFAALIDANQRAFILFFHAGRWLGIRLDLLAAVCVTASAIIVVLLGDSLAPGLAGVILVQSLQLTGVFQYGIRLAAETENLFTSVERIQAYSQLSTEEGASTTPGTIARDWPQRGSIEFCHYSMAYREGLPPVLNDVSFNLQGGSKMGILGRTGAGKSSLAAALFRMVENKACSGSILVDGINIRDVGLDDLRQRISIIPQDPVLFRGTVRSNLDPFQQHSDVEIHEAIEKVRLTAKIRSLVDGLDSVVAENGENFSVGQRQLLCLARSFLRKSRVIVMDEATASVDGGTDRIIQETMRQVFKDCTVLTIAHRIETVIDADVLLVLGEGGRVLEFESPVNLLKRADDGTENVFATMVAKCGPAIVKQLTDEAEKAEARRLTTSLGTNKGHTAERQGMQQHHSPG